MDVTESARVDLIAPYFRIRQQLWFTTIVWPGNLGVATVARTCPVGLFCSRKFLNLSTRFGWRTGVMNVQVRLSEKGSAKYITRLLGRNLRRCGESVTVYRLKYERSRIGPNRPRLRTKATLARLSIKFAQPTSRTFPG
jgi:hypothetical protein